MFKTAERIFQKDKIKLILDEYANKYDTIDFIKNDPSKFIHRYSSKHDTEIAGFIASMFAYGKRDMFLAKLEEFLTPDLILTDYIRNFDANDNNLNDFNYRFSKGIDIIQIIKILQKLQSENENLESLFKYNYDNTGNITGMLQGVTDYFYSNITENVTQGFYHLLPNPSKKGAMKRMNMMLRWFVRKSEVDIGIWKFIDKSELIIPLDVHVGNISRNLGLLKRNQNDYKSAIEITENLKQFDAADPVKYDFALFGIGVNGISDEIF